MRLRILISFHYYRNTDMDALVASFPEPPEIFADSGGFSAYSVGSEVKADDYIAWLHRWGKYLTTYANLDAIGNPAKTADNQRILEAAGLRPIPVFHAGGEWPYLEAYLERYPYVALGGMVPLDATTALRWAVQCFKRAQPHGTRFHGFGQTSVKVMRALPWYTVDSSSWGGGHRFGQLQLWDDRRARFIGIPLGDHAEVYKHAALIRAHGGDPRIFATRGYGKVRGTDKPKEQGLEERAMVVRMNVTAWLRLEAWLRRHHGPISPPPGWDATGPGVVLADSRGGVEQQDLAIAAHGIATDSAGPKIHLANTNLLDMPRVANDLASNTGPRVYLAEGSGDNLTLAGRAAGGINESELHP